QIFRCCRELRLKCEEITQETLTSVNCNRSRRFNVPMAFLRSQENEETTIADDPSVPVDLMTLLTLESRDVVSYLPDCMCICCALITRPQRKWWLIFDHETAIDRVGTALDHVIFITPTQIDSKTLCRLVDCALKSNAKCYFWRLGFRDLKQTF